jgi:mannosyltransferase
VKKTWLAILAVTLVAFLLRIYRLDFVSLRGDEAFTVIFVQRTWDGLWKGIRTIEPNPPLMYLVLRVWIALVGAGEFVTRYFSAFFGVLCVPLIYRLAREIFSGAHMRRSPADVASLPGGGVTRFAHGDGLVIALVAATLLAINPYQIWHSQDVRNYAMWPALSILALIFFWRWWRRQVADQKVEAAADRTWSSWNLFFFILATLASLYTHYYDAFVLLALNVFVFSSALLMRRWKTLARWIAAQLVLVAAYAPWVLFGTDRVTNYGEASAQQSVSLVDQFSRTLSTFVLSDTVPDAFKLILWLPLALALLAALIYLVRQDRSRASFVILWLAVPTLALYLISIGRPLFLERYLNGIAPAYYLAYAVGLSALLNSEWVRNSLPRLLPLAFGLIFFTSTSAYALSNYYFDPAYAKAPDWRALSQFIAARQQPGDIVIQNFTEMSAIYYQSGTLPVMTLPKGYTGTPADEKTLQQLNRDYRRIWFIPAAPDFWDPDHYVDKYLTHADDREIDTKVAQFGLKLYLTPLEFSPKIIQTNVPLGRAVLVGYRVREFDAAALRIPKGATFAIVLYWRADQPIGNDVNTYIHLAAANGQVVVQQAGPPAEGVYPTSQWRSGDLVVDAHEMTADAAPGTYALTAGMEDSATSVPLTQLTIVQ